MNNNGEVPQYQQTTQPSATINPNVPQGSPSAFGTSLAKEQDQLGQNLSKLGSTIADQAIKMQQLADDNTVIQKENQFRQAMNNAMYTDDGKGLMDQKGHNAKGITQNFTDAVDKLMSDYNQDMVSPTMKQKFAESTAPWLSNMRMQVAKHESDQVSDSYLKDIYTKAAMTIDNAVKNPSVQSFNMMGAELGWQVPDLMKYSGMSKESAMEDLRNRGSAGFLAMAQQLSNNGDSQGLIDLVNVGKGKVNADAWSKASGLVGPLKNRITAYNIVDEMIKSGKYYNPNRTINQATLQQDIAKNYGPESTKEEQIWIPGTGGSINNKEDFFNAVSGQESGGNYDAQNGRTGAFGKYQIMPDNWPNWAAEAGLSSDAPMTPENQEIVAKCKLGQYYDKYGAQGALAAWYAGEENGKRWAEGAPDAIGEGGHYSWDAKQGNGNEPSVSEYVQQSLGRVNGTGTEGHNETRTASAYNPELYQQAIKYAQQKAQEAQYTHTTTIQNAIDSLLKQYPSGSLHSYADIENVVSAAGYTGQDAVTIANGLSAPMNMQRSDENQAWTERQRSRAIKSQNEEDASKAAAQWLINNPNATEAEFVENWGGQGLNPKEELSIRRSMAKADAAHDPYAWNKGENRATFNDVTSTYKLNGLEQVNIRDKITSESLRRKEAGEPPLASNDIKSMIQGEASSITINKGWFGGRDIKSADIPAGYTRTPYGVLNEDGITMDWNASTQQWEVKNG